MKYQPLTVPDAAPLGLRAWLASQTRQIAAALINPSVIGLHFDVTAAEPDKRNDGDVYYANGSTWNPGAGAGLYLRHGGAWVKL